VHFIVKWPASESGRPQRDAGCILVFSIGVLMLFDALHIRDQALILDGFGLSSVCAISTSAGGRQSWYHNPRGA
jgi:hypothetical protein